MCSWKRSDATRTGKADGPGCALLRAPLAAARKSGGVLTKSCDASRRAQHMIDDEAIKRAKNPESLNRDPYLCGAVWLVQTNKGVG